MHRCIVWASCGLGLALLLVGQPLVGQNLELRFLDVGQGDAILIRNQGKSVLVDAGPSRAILPRLQVLGVTALDLLIASHNHADHLGGMAAVLSGLPVRFYMDNGVPTTSQIYARVLSLVESRKVAYLRATARTITVGDATLRIMPPPAELQRDQNNSSIGVEVRRGRFRALLTGDSQQPELSAWLASDSIEVVDALKAPHHGSRPGVMPGWLARTRPKVIVISVGKGNAYGHPDPWALRYYEANGRHVYRTDRDGDVVLQVAPDGGYEVTARRSPGSSVPTPGIALTFTPESLSLGGAGSTFPACGTGYASGKACENTCISQCSTCCQPPGCAYDARPQQSVLRCRPVRGQDRRADQR